MDRAVEHEPRLHLLHASVEDDEVPRPLAQRVLSQTRPWPMKAVDHAVLRGLVVLLSVLDDFSDTEVLGLPELPGDVRQVGLHCPHCFFRALLNEFLEVVCQ